MPRLSSFRRAKRDRIQLDELHWVDTTENRRRLIQNDRVVKNFTIFTLASQWRLFSSLFQFWTQNAVKVAQADGRYPWRHRPGLSSFCAADFRFLAGGWAPTTRVRVRRENAIEPSSRRFFCFLRSLLDTAFFLFRTTRLESLPCETSPRPPISGNGTYFFVQRQCFSLYVSIDTNYGRKEIFSRVKCRSHICIIGIHSPFFKMYILNSLHIFSIVAYLTQSMTQSCDTFCYFRERWWDTASDPVYISIDHNNIYETKNNETTIVRNLFETSRRFVEHIPLLQAKKNVRNFHVQNVVWNSNICFRIKRRIFCTNPMNFWIQCRFVSLGIIFLKPSPTLHQEH